MKTLWLLKYTNLIKFSKHIALILVIILCVACQTSSNTNHQLEEMFGETLLREVHIEKLKAILIIPNGGCNGCISDAETYVSENALILGDGLFTIFTDIMSEKNLRLRIGDKIIQSKFTFVDVNKDITHNSLISIYPIVIFVENGQIERIFNISPDFPNALEDLKSRFSTR